MDKLIITLPFNVKQVGDKAIAIDINGTGPVFDRDFYKHTCDQMGAEKADPMFDRLYCEVIRTIVGERMTAALQKEEPKPACIVPDLTAMAAPAPSFEQYTKSSKKL
jgi:hypothetical protein